MKTTTLQLKHSTSWSRELAIVLIPLLVACFVLAPATRAQCPQICDAFHNTAVGPGALESNTTGTDNTALGSFALNNNNGSENTATGQNSLFANTTGFENTANGGAALFANTTGFENTANGAFALLMNTDGSENTAIGFDALRHNRRGSNNIALGAHAGVNLTTASNNIDISNRGAPSDAATIRIGTVGTHTNTFIAGINGVTVAGGMGVMIDANGQLGTIVSSARYKEKITPMDKTSQAILALQPVTFRYKHELDPDGIPQFGLVAEDVEKVCPDLVARDADGKSYTVRYEAVNAMLLNEFLKARRQIDSQQKQIDVLAATVQRVSAQLESNRTDPQTVFNNN